MTTLKNTIFELAGMDCPSEETLVRDALSELPQVKGARFDLQERTVRVLHIGEIEEVAYALKRLELQDRLISSEEAAPDEALLSASEGSQKVLLRTLLLINAGMFTVEIVTGWLAQSAGLIADSLDMFADALVYGLSFYAISRGATWKRRAARSSGYIQLALALGALAEVVRRLFEGSEPVGSLMMGMAFLALIANATCMALLHKHRSGEVHMRASWIFSTNDVIANAGVIIAGLLVNVLDSPLPDLVVGLIICAVVLKGAIKILKLSAPEKT